MQKAIDALVIATAGVALVTGLVVLRRVVSDPSPVSGASAEPVRLGTEQRQALFDGGDVLLPATSQPKVRLTYFTDYECRFCRRFDEETLPALQTRFPGQIEVVIRNWPLPGHRFAYPSARAAGCAGNQGRFAEFHRELVRTQDSLGIIPFRVLASIAGVNDLDLFDRCAAESSPVTSIEADSRLAREVGGLGTPLVAVGDLLFPAAPQLDDLIAAIAAALAGADG